MTSVSNNTKEVYLYLDSEQYNSGNRSNALFQIDQMKVISFKISDFSMYNVVYTVNSSNNLMNLTYNNNVYNVLLQTGFFENDSLSQNIEDSINNALGLTSIKVSYDPTLAWFAISGFPSAVYYDSAISTCDILLGLTQNQSGTTLVSDSISESIPLDYIYITSTALSPMISTIIPNVSFNNVIQKFVVNNNSGYLIQLQDNGMKKNYAQNPVSITSVDIGLVDKNFKIIPQQTRWSMTIVLEQVLSTSLQKSNAGQYNNSNNQGYSNGNVDPNYNNNYSNNKNNSNYNSNSGSYRPIPIQGIIDLDYR